MPILTPQERIGTRIGGRYRIERVLARGGMSVLFEARDIRTHRSVAVKLLKTEDCVDERRIARFLQEMRLTAELRHPHVVDVLDLGQEDQGVPYLVMELLRGRSLQAELDARATLDVDETLAALLPVMTALAAVHAAGVVHRDIKPDNIFLHAEGAGRVVPKLLDFGIAKLLLSTFDTRTGAVLGTPDYMAPEQVLGGEITPATDVWAMGAVMYRSLCGETPFHSATTAQTLAKLAREPAPLVRVPGVPPALCAAVDRALVREVSGRYTDMSELTTAIVTCAREAGFDVPRAVLSHAAQPAGLPSSYQRTGGTAPTGGARTSAFGRRKAVWRTGLIGLALLGATAIASAGSRHGNERTSRISPLASAAQAEQQSPSTSKRGASALSGDDLRSVQPGSEAAGQHARLTARATATAETSSSIVESTSSAESPHSPDRPGAAALAVAPSRRSAAALPVAPRRRSAAALPVAPRRRSAAALDSRVAPAAPRAAKPLQLGDMPVAVEW